MHKEKQGQSDDIFDTLTLVLYVHLEDLVDDTLQKKKTIPGHLGSTLSFKIFSVVERSAVIIIVFVSVSQIKSSLQKTKDWYTKQTFGRFEG